MGHILRFAFAEGEVYAMFDRYVQGTKPSWKRRAVLTVSLALHAIAAIVLVVYSFVHVEEITPPALSLTFFSAPPPPPPPPPPATEAHRGRAQVDEEDRHADDGAAARAAEAGRSRRDDDDGEEGGVEGGVAGGVKGGVVGGVVGGTGTPGPPPKAKNVPPHMLEQQKLVGRACRTCPTSSRFSARAPARPWRWSRSASTRAAA